MKKLIILTILMCFQFGCADVSIHRVGYGWGQKSQYDGSCIQNTLSAISSLRELNSIENGFQFIANRYKAQLVYKKIEEGGYHYELDLDGRFLGESYGTFVRNAEKIKTEVIEGIRKKCESE